MPSSFIQDFLAYTDGTECHRSFLLWSAFTPVAIAAGKQYEFFPGRFRVVPESCILLVGPSGGKKTTAKDAAMQVVIDALPDNPIAADITSRDDLMRFMASKDTLRFFINPDGAEGEWHPVAIFVDEIRHFMSYSPSAMISFLVAIHGRPHFSGSTIKRGAEDIAAPCLNFLGCTTEDWITEHLKFGILSGGWSRRFLVIYEPEKSKKIIPRPNEVEGSKELEARMREHLTRIRSKSGRFSWGKGAISLFDSWYIENKKKLPEDKHLAAYFETKDMHVLRNCMLVDLSEEKPTLQITVENLEAVLAMHDNMEQSLPKLYLAAGRNELVIPQQRILNLLDSHNGGLPKTEVMRRADVDLGPMEQMAIFKHLESSKRIVTRNIEVDGMKVEMMMTLKKWLEVQKNGGRWASSQGENSTEEQT